MIFRVPCASVATALCTCALIATAEPVTQRPATPPSKDQILAVARRVMEKTRFAALMTVDAGGRPQARTMDTFPPDPEMVVWMATNPRSRKVRQIEKDPRVALYYFDPETSAYVTLHGTARLVTDPEQKKKWWKAEWSEFYPDREAGYLLIAVTPERLEVVSVEDGIDTDPTTWTPAAVEFPISR
jgi:general stress protein 26